MFVSVAALSSILWAVSIAINCVCLSCMCALYLSLNLSSTYAEDNTYCCNFAIKLLRHAERFSKEVEMKIQYAWRDYQSIHTQHAR